jgi:hypothetical protein
VLPTIEPSFETAIVMSFATEREVAFDEYTTDTLISTTVTEEQTILKTGLCDAQLASQGLTGTGECAIDSITQKTASARARALVAANHELSKNSRNLKGSSSPSAWDIVTSLFLPPPPPPPPPHHPSKEAELARYGRFHFLAVSPLAISFITKVSMINFGALSVEEVYSNIQAAVSAYPASNFSATLSTAVVSAGGSPITCNASTVTFVGSYAVILPPTFMPTMLPTLKPVAPQAASSSSSGGSGLSLGAIIGIAVGGVVLFTLVAGGIYLAIIRLTKPRVYAEV